MSLACGVVIILRGVSKLSVSRSAFVSGPRSAVDLVVRDTILLVTGVIVVTVVVMITTIVITIVEMTVSVMVKILLVLGAILMVLVIVVADATSMTILSTVVTVVTIVFMVMDVIFIKDLVVKIMMVVSVTVMGVIVSVAILMVAVVAAAMVIIMVVIALIDIVMRLIFPLFSDVVVVDVGGHGVSDLVVMNRSWGRLSGLRCGHSGGGSLLSLFLGCGLALWLGLGGFLAEGVGDERFLRLHSVGLISLRMVRLFREVAIAGVVVLLLAEVALHMVRRMVNWVFIMINASVLIDIIIVRVAHGIVEVVQIVVVVFFEVLVLVVIASMLTMSVSLRMVGVTNLRLIFTVVMGLLLEDVLLFSLLHLLLVLGLFLLPFPFLELSFCLEIRDRSGGLLVVRFEFLVRLVRMLGLIVSVLALILLFLVHRLPLSLSLLMLESPLIISFDIGLCTLRVLEHALFLRSRVVRLCESHSGFDDMLSFLLLNWSFSVWVVAREAKSTILLFPLDVLLFSLLFLLIGLPLGIPGVGLESRLNFPFFPGFLLGGLVLLLLRLMVMFPEAVIFVAHAGRLRIVTRGIRIIKDGNYGLLRLLIDKLDWFRCCSMALVLLTVLFAKLSLSALTKDLFLLWLLLFGASVGIKVFLFLLDFTSLTMVLQSFSLHLLDLPVLLSILLGALVLSLTFLVFIITQVFAEV